MAPYRRGPHPVRPRSIGGYGGVRAHTQTVNNKPKMGVVLCVNEAILTARTHRKYRRFGRRINLPANDRD